MSANQSNPRRRGNTDIKWTVVVVVVVVRDSNNENENIEMKNKTIQLDT